MIGFNRVSKEFSTPDGVNVVLHNATLEFDENAQIGVLARPGTGKSMIARMLAGLERPSSGTVMPPRGRFWRLGDASVFVPNLSGEANVRNVADLFGLDSDEVSGFVADVVELGDRYFDRLNTYSGSMRGRLGFALSIALPVDFYIADQGVQVGVGRYRDKCETLLNQRLDRAGLFVITSNAGFGKRTCAEFAVLQDGAFVRCDDFEQANEMFKERLDDVDQIHDLIEGFDNSILRGGQ